MQNEAMPYRSNSTFKNVNGLLPNTVLNSLSANIAILDAQGVILETNQAWKNFAGANQMKGQHDSIGVNYFEICEAVSGEESVAARKVADGIRSVIKGDISEFLFDYPCHSPEEKRWHYMRAIRIQYQDPIFVVVSHEDITALKVAEESLKKREQELEHQKQSLEEANIALKVLLTQREADKVDLEKKILINIKQMVFPYLDKLKKSTLKPREKTLVEIIDSHLNDIISPFLQRLVSINVFLTPQEMKIATLIKDGKSSKEIADLLNVSETTVHFHRKNLRIKFGLTNKQTNLRSYLLSLS
jgi:DNA-binding CsgD family transcriptional regulator